MTTAIRPVTPGELAAVLAMNNAAVPNVNTLNAAELRWFADNAPYFRVALGDDGNVCGFLIALAPGSPYESPNYRWFQERHDRFVYIDRVVVDPKQRTRGVGSALYADVEAYASGHAPLLTCEVNLRPANPSSWDFHVHRGFVQVGTQDTESGSKTVALLVKKLRA